MEQHSLKVIARIYNDFTDKFGIPRQSGQLGKMVSKIVFEKEFRNDAALSGLEEFSHIWLIWQFSQSVRETWSPTVRPPRLGGNKRVGVFASRAPFRPNAIGMSAVKIIKIVKETGKGSVIYVSGADMMSGTPIYDIKPYIPFCDCIEDAKEGYTKQTKNHFLNVTFKDGLKEKLDRKCLENLIGILSGDPRPSYICDPDRIYGMRFSDMEIKFKADDKNLVVVSIEKEEK